MSGRDPGASGSGALDPASLDPGWRERAAVQGAAYARAVDGSAEETDPGTSESGVDPLRLCVFTTVALLGWLLGPWAVLVFATLAFTAYVEARRGGLLRSKCLLRDTRLVLAWLGLLVMIALVAIGRGVAQLL